MRKYNRQGQDLVEQDTSKAKEEGVRLLQRNLSYIDGEFIRHNPDAIASSIIELICEDMKFRDMENDSRYVMLNSRLKDTKKKIKKTMPKQNMNKTKHIKNEKVSKFAEKYQDRIDSIKQSEKKTQNLREQKMKEKIQREEYIGKQTKQQNMQSQKINTKKQNTKEKINKWLKNKNNTRKPKH